MTLSRAGWAIAGGVAGSVLAHCGSTQAPAAADGGAIEDARAVEASVDAGTDATERDVAADAAEGCTCAASEICVKYVTRAGSPGAACWPLAAACDGGVATCACMTETACPPDAGPNRVCEATTNPTVLLCVDNRP